MVRRGRGQGLASKIADVMAKNEQETFFVRTQSDPGPNNQKRMGEWMAKPFVSFRQRLSECLPPRGDSSTKTGTFPTDKLYNQVHSRRSDLARGLDIASKIAHAKAKKAQEEEAIEVYMRRQAENEETQSRILFKRAQSDPGPTNGTRMARCREWRADDDFESPNGSKAPSRTSSSGVQQAVAASVLGSSPASHKKSQAWRQQEMPNKSMQTSKIILEKLSLVKTDRLFEDSHSSKHSTGEDIVQDNENVSPSCKPVLNTAVPWRRPRLQGAQGSKSSMISRSYSQRSEDSMAIGFRKHF
jgi:hypothetical protein